MNETCVCAVVVTYNRLQLLQKNIKSLTSLPDEMLQRIVVVNNCSTDGTADWLASQDDPRLEVIELKQNLGGSGGFNKGLRYVVEHGYDWAWIMDDDTIVNNETLPHLLETTRRTDNVGFVCSHIKWVDGSPCRMNVPKFFRRPQPPLPTGEIPIRYATFVSLLISVRAIKKIGLPYQEYFIWTDDVEYTWRLNHNGFYGFYNPESTALHETPVNYGSSIQDAPLNAAWRFYYQSRNETHFRRKKAPFFLYFLVDAILAFRRKKKRVRRRRDVASQAIFMEKITKGFWDGLKFNPSIEYV